MLHKQCITIDYAKRILKKMLHNVDIKLYTRDSQSSRNFVATLYYLNIDT